MNTQLVHSLIQVILSLPAEERALLGEKLSAANPLPPSTDPSWTEEAIDTFLALGREAVPGRLQNSAVNHDRYLYGDTPE
jgi:hypothetical protein